MTAYFYLTQYQLQDHIKVDMQSYWLQISFTTSHHVHGERSWRVIATFLSNKRVSNSSMLIYFSINNQGYKNTQSAHWWSWYFLAFLVLLSTRKRQLHPFTKTKALQKLCVRKVLFRATPIELIMPAMGTLLSLPTSSSLPLCP